MRSVLWIVVDSVLGKRDACGTVVCTVCTVWLAIIYLDTLSMIYKSVCRRGE